MSEPTDISTQQYQIRVVQQHVEIVRALEEVKRSNVVSAEITARALENMRMALLHTLKIPVAVAIVAAVSWLFAMGKIEEKTWMTFCLVSVFPWFGDSIRMIVGIFRSDPGKTENIVNAAKLFVLCTAFLFLSAGCEAVQTYNSHVAAREDSLSGYAKGSNYGGAYTHRVEYR